MRLPGSSRAGCCCPTPTVSRNTFYSGSLGLGLGKGWVEPARTATALKHFHGPFELRFYHLHDLVTCYHSIMDQLKGKRLITGGNTVSLSFREQPSSGWLMVATPRGSQGQPHIRWIKPSLAKWLCLVVPFSQDKWSLPTRDATAIWGPMKATECPRTSHLPECSHKQSLGQPRLYRQNRGRDLAG